MTFQYLVNSSFDKLTIACESLHGAVQELNDYVQQLDRQLGHSSESLREPCVEMLSGIEEAKGNHSQMPTLGALVHRLAKKARRRFVYFTQRLDIYRHGGCDVPPELNGKRYAVADALMNVEIAADLMSESCPTDGETLPSAEPCQVPNDVKDQANRLCQVIGEVHEKTGAWCAEVRGHNTYKQLDHASRRTMQTLCETLLGPPEQGALGRLRYNCETANGILANTCLTTRDVVATLDKYETQVKDAMNQYKGVYEHIDREASSCKLPPEFLQHLSVYLPRPFEVWDVVNELIARARTSLNDLEEVTEKSKRRGVRVDVAQFSHEALKSVKGIESNLETLGSAVSLTGTGGGGGYASGSPINIEARISSGIASVVGVDLKPPHTTDAEVLAFAQKLKTTLQKSVIKTSRYGSPVYELQRGGAVSTGSVSSNQIRGTQATFYKQAVQIKELVLDLVDKLVCQLNVCDEETIDFFKEDIRTNVSEIVAEVGREGGALAPRVLTLLQSLRDDLRDLRAALGIQAPAVQQRDMDIAEQEENERNFRLLADSLINQPSSLEGVLGRYFVEINNATGTVLSNLLRTVEAIPSSIQEIYLLMDSVRLGEVDRRVTLIQGTTTVEQLLSWIEISAGTDWPSRLGIGDTREVEVRAVERTANEQIRLLDLLIANLPNLIQTGVNRVRGALRELRRELDNVRTFARSI